jgi:hypothetical protein
MAKAPAHLAPYVDVLGADAAIALFLALGGSQIYLPRRSGSRTVAAQTIGADNVERLAAVLGYGYIKVPLARQWIAEAMRAEGRSDNEIARLVRADVATVRRWLGPKSTAEQLNLPI